MICTYVCIFVWIRRKACLLSVQFSYSIVSDFGTPMHCSTPGFPVHYQLQEPTNSCPLHWWCHPIISPSAIPFSSCPQSLPASGPFPVSQFFASSGQSLVVSASASVLLMNIQDWFPLGLTGWISLQSKGLSRVFSSSIVQNIISSMLSFLYSPALTSLYDYWKNHTFD